MVINHVVVCDSDKLLDSYARNLTGTFFLCKVNSDLTAFECLSINVFHGFLGIVDRLKFSKCKPKSKELCQL